MRREAAETSSRETFLHGRGSGGRDWNAVAEVAQPQHGVVSLEQLIDRGFTASGVRTLVEAGRLHRVYRGVYALSPASLTRFGNWMAAVLACGPGSLLSFRSGGALQGLIKTSRSRIDVTTPQQVRRAGIQAHRCIVHPDDRAEVNDIPCTSVARTLLDLAAVVRAAQLQDALEQAEELGHFDLRAIEAVLKRNRGHRGAKRLRTALVALTADDHLFRSRFERLFLPISRSAGMPEPLVNHTIHLPDRPIEVDFYWPTLRLVVEVDGYRFHGDRRGFAEDRRRDRRLAEVGIRCLRYVWDDLANLEGIRRELAAVAAT